MKRALSLFISVSCLIGALGFGQEPNPRLDAVKKYILEKDYPEVFGKTDYKTRIEDVLDADVDNDGSKEVIVLYFPNYRQSAPIVLYKIDNRMKVTRVAEGLAPGPLQKLSGDYLDSHVSGQAVDFEIPAAQATPEKVMQIFTEKGMNGFVIYDSFYHADGRTGPPWIVDMRGVKLPSEKHDCSSFEFSRVKQIAVGHTREDSSQNYLAAWVGDEIYVYLIHGVSAAGMLDKKLWVINVPAGFNGFQANQGLTYKTGTGVAVLALK